MKKTGGMNNAGSIFSVFMSFISKMDSPEAAIKKPPTIVISDMKAVVKIPEESCTKIIEPCQQNKPMQQMPYRCRR